MGISVTQLLILLVIIIIVFGTKRLRNVGTDLGDAIKNFRTAVKSSEEEKNLENNSGNTADSELAEKQTEKSDTQV